MAGATFTLTGDRALVAQFRALSQAMQGQHMAHAAKAGALLVSNEAKRRAPFDTGTLRRSIHVGAPQISGSSVEVKVGTDVSYAIYQELGTRRMAAHPYLRPALESMRGAVEAEVSAALRALLGGAV